MAGLQIGSHQRARYCSQWMNQKVRMEHVNIWGTFYVSPFHSSWDKTHNNTSNITTLSECVSALWQEQLQPPLVSDVVTALMGKNQNLKVNSAARNKVEPLRTDKGWKLVTKSTFSQGKTWLVLHRLVQMPRTFPDSLSAFTEKQVLESKEPADTWSKWVLSEQTAPWEGQTAHWSISVL